jgi:hypothetical protein
MPRRAGVRAAAMAAAADSRRGTHLSPTHGPPSRWAPAPRTTWLETAVGTSWSTSTAQAPRLSAGAGSRHRRRHRLTTRRRAWMGCPQRRANTHTLRVYPRPAHCLTGASRAPARALHTCTPAHLHACTPPYPSQITARGVHGTDLGEDQGPVRDAHRRTLQAQHVPEPGAVAAGGVRAEERQGERSEGACGLRKGWGRAVGKGQAVGPCHKTLPAKGLGRPIMLHNAPEGKHPRTPGSVQCRVPGVQWGAATGPGTTQRSVCPPPPRPQK